MTVLCSKCNKAVTKGRNSGVKCVKCEQAYHINCGNISDEIYKGLCSGSKTWLCDVCVECARKSIIACDDETDLLKLNVSPNLTEILFILKSMQRKLDKLDDLERSQSFVCSSLDELNNTVKQLNNAYNKVNAKLVELEEKYSKQEVKINLMEAQLDLIYQAENKNNIVICGLPTSLCNEDDNKISSFVSQTLSKVYVNIKSGDIASIKQMVHNKNSNSTLKNSFIVALNSLELKNNIISAFNIKKKSSPNEIKGFNIINHFTKFQSRLYKEAKHIQHIYKFQFLWNKEGKIFLRKSNNSAVHHIFSSNDIIRIQNGFRTLVDVTSAE